MNRSMLFRQDLVLAALLITVIVLMIIPLPQALIDVLIGINITLAILLLMVAIYLKHPSDFSTFPSVILFGTAFRLAISIATTRMILTEADAGQIIDTFGNFVIGGTLIVGLVIFLIITTVQFIVITKGAERVAEVAARFCLDALPGKQMSIDAEVRAGNIDQEEGNRRRQKLDKDNQFFGAMDGAMKFVKGDAIAGLIITAVNLLGGIGVGMAVHGYSLAKSVEVYSLLTVGDGLVAQIPALFMSMCAATIITRVTHSESSDLGTEISHQLGSDRRALLIAAVAVLGLGFIPGFPWHVFTALAAALVLFAFFLSRKPAEKLHENSDEQDGIAHETGVEAAEGSTAQDTVIDPDNMAAQSDYPETERHVLNLGSELFSVLVKDNIYQYRDEVYKAWHNSTGVQFPAFSILGDQTLSPWSMRVYFDNVPVVTCVIPQDHMFVVADSDIKDLLPGDAEATPKDWPGEVGYWIPTSIAENLPGLKTHICSTSQVVAEAAFRVGESFAGQLFSRKEFAKFMGVIEEQDSMIVEELAEAFTVVGLIDILRRLMEDGIPLKPEKVVAETLYQWCHKSKDPSILADAVRLALRRQICYSLADENGMIASILLDPAAERAIRKALRPDPMSMHASADKGLVLDPKTSEQIIGGFQSLRAEGQGHRNRRLVVVTTPDIRRAFRNFLAMNNIHYPVISFQEIAPEVTVQPITMIRLSGENVRPPKAA